MGIVKPVNHRWHYCGDMNLECGGFFWKEDDSDDYVLAVEVTPCSDACGPSNLFWVESGSIYLGDEKRQASALECTGDDPATASRFERIYAMRAYAGIDPDSYRSGRYVVQIGKNEAKDADPWQWGGTREPDYILRGNASLKRFIRREFLGLSR